ncbi:MAG: AAA family ATPase [Patescibacteria group bacterium]
MQSSLFLAIAFLVALPLLIYLYSKIGSGGVSFGGSAVLNKYAKDLTRMAREKKLDPVVGRKEEIARVVQILSRRNKNNPVLIGKAGIGKTAIVEGLAHLVVNDEVPPILRGKRVLSLDLAGLLAGTKYRGEFEQRLKKITDEITAARRMIILFIDEIHILSEAGEAEGAINAADILKPMLARGELQVVGATTAEEYNKYIKNDKTLDRRLQPIFVSEPTAAQTKNILAGVKNVYEDYHEVEILPSALEAAIKLTAQFKDKSYPDKAIDALDEASSKVRIKAGNKKGNSKVGEKEVRSVINEWKKNN